MDYDIARRRKKMEQALLKACLADTKTFCSKGHSSSYRGGQILYYADHITSGFYLLKKGAALLRHCKPDGFLCREVKMTGPCFLGLRDFLQDRPYFWDAFITEESEVFFFPKAVLDDLLSNASLKDKEFIIKTDLPKQSREKNSGKK